MTVSACRQGARSQSDLIDVNDVDKVMEALEIRCFETRTTMPSLADVAVKAVAVAQQRGQTLTQLQALRLLESSIHEGADMKIDCADAADRLFSEPRR